MKTPFCVFVVALLASISLRSELAHRDDSILDIAELDVQMISDDDQALADKPFEPQAHGLHGVVPLQTFTMVRGEVQRIAKAVADLEEYVRSIEQRYASDKEMIKPHSDEKEDFEVLFKVSQPTVIRSRVIGVANVPEKNDVS